MTNTRNLFTEPRTTILFTIRADDIARLILILYCVASIFKTIIDRIFICSFQYNNKIVASRM